MARGRFISKTLGSSQKFESLGRIGGKIGDFSQTLYMLLVTNADDFGRLPGDSFTAKFRIFPTSKHSTEDFEKALCNMKQVGLIERYSVKGAEYVQVVHFEEHQVGLHKRTKSYFPEIPGNSRNVVELPSQQEEVSQQEVESKQESKQESEAEEGAAPTTTDPPPKLLVSDPVVMLFPTADKPTKWGLLQSKVDEYRDTYAELDIVRECRNARQWCVDNRNKRKPFDEIPAFLNSWLKRSQSQLQHDGNGKSSRRDPAVSNSDQRCVCCKVEFVSDLIGGFKMGCKCKPLQWCEEHMKCETCCGCHKKKLQNSSTGSQRVFLKAIGN